MSRQLLPEDLDLNSKQAKEDLEKKKRSYYARKRQFIESKNKRVILTNAELFKTLGPLNLPIYGKSIHFKDACITLSRKAISRKENAANAIKDDLYMQENPAVKQLQKRWDAKYPEVRKEQSSGDGVMNYVAKFLQNLYKSQKRRRIIDSEMKLKHEQEDYYRARGRLNLPQGHQQQKADVDVGQLNSLIDNFQKSYVHPAKLPPLQTLENAETQNWWEEASEVAKDPNLLTPP